MAIDFPNSPANGALYTAGGKTWQWNGTYWAAYGTGPVLRTSDTPPASPNAGDLWYETDTGRFFTYIDSAWVEIGNATDIAGALQPSQVTALSAVTSLTSDDVFPVVDSPASATATNKITWGNVQSSITSTGTLSSLVVSGSVTSSTDYLLSSKSMPRGIIASTTSSSNTLSGGIATGLNTTFTAVANRRYRISLKLVTSMPADTCRILVTCASNRFIDWTNGAAGFPIFYSSWVTTFAAGSQSLQVAFNIIAGSPSLNAEASNQHQLIVEDIGVL